jgi:hypothetical protein
MEVSRHPPRSDALAVFLTTEDQGRAVDAEVATSTGHLASSMRQIANFKDLNWCAHRESNRYSNSKLSC